MQRFFEVDALRGLAVIAMVAFHSFFALDFLAGYSFELGSGLLLLIGRFASISFVFLAGLSLPLSYNRAVKKLHGLALFSKYLFRGIWIFSLGMAITLVSLLAFPQYAIFFGVLHCIGLSIILAFPFLRLRGANFFLGWLFVIAGLFLWNLSFQSPLLLWLGFKPVLFQSLDYFPLLPWFGLVLLGVFAGNELYPEGKRRFSIPSLSAGLGMKSLCFLGRHSLVIYFLHFPILVAAVQLLAV
jgi:uncharacterized membrane protein